MAIWPGHWYLARQKKWRDVTLIVLSGASTRVEIDQFWKKIWIQHRPNVFEPWDIWRRALRLITGAHFVPIYRLCSVKLDFSKKKLAYCDSIHRFLLKMLQKMKFSTNSNYVFAFIFNSVLSWQGFWHVILRELGPEYFPTVIATNFKLLVITRLTNGVAIRITE